MKIKTSKLWESLAQDKFSNIDESFLAHFREPGNANNRLAAWDPFDRTMRYFKFLFFHQIQTKDDLFFTNYAKIGATSLGNPVMLRAPSGIEVNLDHFFSIEEYTFLNSHLCFAEIAHVVEIGAGFGRTAQALIKLAGNIEKYTIIDIPEVLSLSSKYLEKVLSNNEFAKLEFVDALSITRDNRSFNAIDLAVNIDSFQEMPPETVRHYLDTIISNSKYFYSKNAVGKYTPESVGLYDIKKEQLQDVFALGLSTDVIDIFDPEALVKAREKHVEHYTPSKRYTAIAQEPLGIFPYYLNVLYRRDNTVTCT